MAKRRVKIGTCLKRCHKRKGKYLSCVRKCFARPKRKRSLRGRGKYVGRSHR